jgi:Na+-transporting NADH:ubiquinone oxidoreductase subunit NqrC
MNSKTKKIFLVSLVVALVAGSLAGAFYYVVAEEAKKLDQQLLILNENNTKESAYVRTKRLVGETEAERATLAANFFKDEGDSIAFLGEIEKLARDLGLVLKTEALDKVAEKDKQEFIKATFVYTGRKDLVFDFSRLLELTPYNAEIVAMSLGRTDKGDWSGKTTMLITIDTI